jgi:hypothetical protein
MALGFENRIGRQKRATQRVEPDRIEGRASPAREARRDDAAALYECAQRRRRGTVGAGLLKPLGAIGSRDHARAEDPLPTATAASPACPPAPRTRRVWPARSLAFPPAPAARRHRRWAARTPAGPSGPRSAAHRHPCAPRRAPRGRPGAQKRQRVPAPSPDAIRPAASTPGVNGSLGLGGRSPASAARSARFRPAASTPMGNSSGPGAPGPPPLRGRGLAGRQSGVRDRPSWLSLAAPC